MKYLSPDRQNQIRRQERQGFEQTDPHSKRTVLMYAWVGIPIHFLEAFFLNPSMQALGEMKGAPEGGHSKLSADGIMSSFFEVQKHCVHVAQISMTIRNALAQNPKQSLVRFSGLVRQEGMATCEC